MRAMAIVALIFAMLGKGAIGTWSVFGIINKKPWPYIVISAAMGVLFIGDLIFLIGFAAGSSGAIITGCVLWLLGWIGSGAFVVLGVLFDWKKPLQMTQAPAAQPQTYYTATLADEPQARQ